MSYRRIKHMKAKVLEILKENPEARNSDVALMIEIWRRHFPSLIKVGKMGQEGVWLASLYELPHEDEIGRVRRKIQESGKYLPTDEKIAKARRLNMDEWRVSMGYATKESAGTEHPSWIPPSEKKVETEQPSLPL